MRGGSTYQSATGDLMRDFIEDDKNIHHDKILVDISFMNRGSLFASTITACGGEQKNNAKYWENRHYEIGMISVNSQDFCAHYRAPNNPEIFEISLVKLPNDPRSQKIMGTGEISLIPENNALPNKPLQIKMKSMKTGTP